MAESGVNPSEISVDEQGRVIINNPILAAALRENLASGERPGPRLRPSAPGHNLDSCGQNC
jgi:hypothetical protein